MLEISKHKVDGGSYVVTLEAFGHALNSGLLMEEEADYLVQSMEKELGAVEFATEDKVCDELEAFLESAERYLSALIDSLPDFGENAEPTRELLTPEYIHGWMEAYKEEEPICKLYDFLQMHDMAEEADLGENFCGDDRISNSDPFFQATKWDADTIKLVTKKQVSYLTIEQAAFEIAKMHGRAYDRD